MRKNYYKTQANIKKYYYKKNIMKRNYFKKLFSRRIKKIFFFVKTYNNGKPYNTRTKANRRKKEY